MWGVVCISGNMVAPTSEHCGGPGPVSAQCVGQPDSQLGKSLPQVTLGVRGCLPAGFQDLVGLERATFIQKSLGLGQAFRRLQDKVIGNRWNSGLSSGKRAAERISWTGIARPTAFVTFSVRAH
jgi:hypothetical protein